MKKILLFIIYLIAVCTNSFSQTPTIGTYSNTSVVAGGNTSITPTVPPANIINLSAYSSVRFRGILHVDSATGKLFVTNAQPAGTYTITIKGYNAAGTAITTSAMLTVSNPNCSQGLLSNAPDVPVGGQYSKGIGDFNSDGKLDLAIGNGSKNLVIRLGDGAGNFTGTTSIYIGYVVYDICVGDINNDGRQDLLLNTYDNSKVYVLLGDGAGGFTIANMLAFTNIINRINMADLNGDGKLDFTTVFNGGGVGIRLGTGTGSFTARPDVAMPYASKSLAINDFNGDGKPDLAVTNDYYVCIRLGDGTGGFSGNGIASGGTNPLYITTGDFNSDGKVDFATATWENVNQIQIRMGDGSGNFSGYTYVDVGSPSTDLTTGDFNGDGKLDLVNTNSVSGSVTILSGNGAGGFTIQSVIPTGPYPGGVVSGDFNRDNYQDLAVISSENTAVAIRLGGANDVVVQSNGVAIPDGSTTPSTIDNTDFGSTASTTTRTYTLQNPGLVSLNIGSIGLSGADTAAFRISGITTPVVVAPGGSVSFSVSFIPISAGSKLAIISVNSNHCTKAVYDFAIRGNGVATAPSIGTYSNTTIPSASRNIVIIPSALPANASFTSATTTSRFKGSLQVDSATGKVIITNAHPAGTYLVTVRAGNWSGTVSNTFTLTVNNTQCSQGNFSDNGTTGTPGGPIRLMMRVADCNNDGKQDLVIMNETIAVRFGNGDGSFLGIAPGIPVNQNVYDFTVADFNGDGKPDVAYSNNTAVSIRLGDGTGNFTGNIEVPVAAAGNLVAGDFNNDGKTDLLVANIAFTNSTIEVKWGDGTGNFTTGSSIPFSREVRCLAVADFNNDGNLDFSASTSATTIATRLGNGAGGFTTVADVTVGYKPVSINTGDFNADGNPDFVTANNDTRNISVRLGNGNGGFTGTTDIAVDGEALMTAIGDFNGDGKQDIAVAKNSYYMKLFLGTGTGSFTAMEDMEIPDLVRAVAIGDFNADGRQDLAIGIRGTASNIVIRLGTTGLITVKGNNTLITNGDSTPDSTDFTSFGDVSVGAVRNRTFTIQNTGGINLLINSITIGGADTASFKINGITLPFTLASGASTTFSVRFQTVTAGLKSATVFIGNSDCGNSAFTYTVQANSLLIVPDVAAYPGKTIIAGGNATIAPAAAPINTLQLYAYSTNTLFRGSIAANLSTGVLTITNAYPAGIYPIVVKGINGVSTDTSLFLLTVGTNATCSSGLFGANQQTVTGNGPQRMAVADFNKDGNQDLMVANYYSSSVSVKWGNSTGNFGTATTVSTGVSCRSVGVGDFNGDGNMDFAAVNNTFSGTVSVRLGNGSGGFSNTAEIAVDSMPEAIAITDFNNDGIPDMAVASSKEYGSIAIRLGNGSGGFTGTLSIPAGRFIESIVAADFNGDGNMDFATTSFNATGSVAIRLGNGTGGFTTAADVPVGSYPYTVVTGDFNEDGKIDLAVANQSGNSVSIRMGNGNGTFTGTANLSVVTNPTHIAIADFNADTRQDLAVTSLNTKTVSILSGNGAGGFQKTTDVAFTGKFAGLATGDFNNDGRQDFVVSEMDSARMAVRLNALNEIDITGNGNSIPAGNNAPSLNNKTDFDSTGTSITNVFTIRNTGSTTLTVDSIKVLGADSAQFVVGNISWPVAIAGGGNSSFTVKFLPAGTGVKTTRLRIYNNDCDEGLYDFALKGTGVYTPVAIGTYQPAILQYGGNGLLLPGTISNAASVTATTTSSFQGLLQVDPATGGIRITNACPAGTYTITIKAVNGSSSATTSFILTVATASCSTGGLFSSTTPSFSGTTSGTIIADVNKDGRQDVISKKGYEAIIYLNNGAGGLTRYGAISIPTAQILDIAPADYNGDGNIDLAISNNAGTYIKLGDGAGNFSGSVVVPVPAYRVVAADFNKDGFQDIATVDLMGWNTSTWLGNGSGNFTNAARVSFSTYPQDIAIADFDNDGNPDMATALEYIDSVAIWFGNGTGGFNSPVSVDMGRYPSRVISIDFNRDGKPDLAVLNHYNGNIVSVRLGNGIGGFNARTAIPVGFYPSQMVTADFNGDGNADLAVGDGYTRIVFRTGDGTGNFTTGTQLTAASSVQYNYLTVADLNQDNRHDLVAGGGSVYELTLLTNAGNEINVQGNSTTIPDGDSIPTLAKHTSFGTVALGNSLTRTFTIQNTGVGTALTVSSIRISGADSASFTRSGITLPATIAAGVSATFTVTFTPQNNGVKTATVIIVNNDCDEGIYDFAISGSVPAPGAALDFDGIDDYAGVNDPVTGNIGDSAITLSAYIKTSSVTASSLLSKRVDCTQGSYFDFGITAAGRLTFILGDAAGHVQSITGRKVVNDTVWHQVTAVRSADTLRLYVDGYPDTSVVTNGVANINNSVSMLVGASVCNGIANFFKGQMDEVRLFSRALSTAEVQVKASCELGGTQAGLLLYYKFNQGNAAATNTGLITLQDASGQGRSGTLQNFALTGSTSNWVTPGGVATGILCTGRSVWLGLTPNWNDPANWSTGFVPLEMTKVIVNTGVPNPPEITTPDAVCYSLTLQNGATVIVRSTGHLTIMGP